jgi:hypothetical protein
MTIHHGRPQLIPLGNGASAERAAYDEAIAPLRRLRRQLASVKGARSEAPRAERPAPSAEQLAILKRAGVDVAAFLSTTDAALDAPSATPTSATAQLLSRAGVTDLEAFTRWQARQGR